MTVPTNTYKSNGKRPRKPNSNLSQRIRGKENIRNAGALPGYRWLTFVSNNGKLISRRIKEEDYQAKRKDLDKAALYVGELGKGLRQEALNAMQASMDRYDHRVSDDGSTIEQVYKEKDGAVNTQGRLTNGGLVFFPDSATAKPGQSWLDKIHNGLFSQNFFNTNADKLGPRTDDEVAAQKNVNELWKSGFTNVTDSIVRKPAVLFGSNGSWDPESAVEEGKYDGYYTFEGPVSESSTDPKARQFYLAKAGYDPEPKNGETLFHPLYFDEAGYANIPSGSGGTDKDYAVNKEGKFVEMKEADAARRYYKERQEKKKARNYVEVYPEGEEDEVDKDEPKPWEWERLTPGYTSYEKSIGTRNGRAKAYGGPMPILRDAYGKRLERIDRLCNDRYDFFI